MSQIYGRLFKTGNLSSSHLIILGLVKNNSEVLELGASTGYLTKIMQKRGCRVDIVELDSDDALIAKGYARGYFIGDLDDKVFLEKIKGRYDVVVAADIIEHLKNDLQCLKFIKGRLRKNGRLILSLPNIACWEMRKDLFFKGNFIYQESGLLDKTHLRFFTYYTIQNRLKEAGFRNLTFHLNIASYPFRPRILLSGQLGRRIDKILSRWLITRFPNLTAFHLIIEAI